MPEKPFYLKWIPRAEQPWQVDSWVIVVPEGKSIIQYAQCRPESLGDSRFFLLLDGKPLAYVEQACPTCSGILQTGYAGKADVDLWLAGIRKAVKDERRIDEYYEAFLPIIALFGRGVYSVGVVEYSVTSPDGLPSISQFGTRREHSGLATGNGPFGPRFLEPLQPDWMIDHDVVQAYIEIIAQGGRPVGIAYYYYGFVSFLLDGHHKAVAYTALGMEIPCVTIYPMASTLSGDGNVHWGEYSVGSSGDDSRIVRAEELPAEFVAELEADIASRWSGVPRYLDDVTARRYLRLLGVSQ